MQQLRVNLVDSSILLSDKKFHSKNIQFIKEILTENSYPTEVIEKYIKKRLFYHKNNDYSPNIKPKISFKNQILQQKYFNSYKLKIPYKYNLFNKVKYSLKRYNITTIPDLQKNLSSVIKKGEDRINKFEKTSVVYKIGC